MLICFVCVVKCVEVLGWKLWCIIRGINIFVVEINCNIWIMLNVERNINVCIFIGEEILWVN